MAMIQNGLRYDSARKLFTIEYPWIKDPHCLPNNIEVAKKKTALNGTKTGQVILGLPKSIFGPNA